MPHFFISYSKKDTRQLAIDLNDALNNLPDVTCWVDKSMRAGRSWEIQIESEIDKCDYIVVLYSEDLHRHKQGQKQSYVLKEITYAQHYANKQIIPVMAQATQPPMSLITEHYIDYIGQGLNLEGLVKAICFEVGISINFSPPLVQAPSTSPLPSLEISEPAATPPRTRRTLPNPLPSKHPHGRVHNNLPAPFEWVEIPAGRVTLIPDPYDIRNSYLKLSTTFNVPAFAIAKYPVTNAQFAKFIKLGGYENRQWWTDRGWEVRKQGWVYDGHEWKRTRKAWTEPRYWMDKKWNGRGYPVVGVSWYEAEAFCQWLNEVVGVSHDSPLQTITLPTEQQWQRAAQGNSYRTYPWGNEWESNRCNTSESNVGKTTIVTRFEGKSESLFGVVDMVGNVWEWCLTDYKSVDNEFDNNRVLRGGSWYNFHFDASTTSRYHNNSIYRFSNIGFRVCRSPS